MAVHVDGDQNRRFPTRLIEGSLGLRRPPSSPEAEQSVLGCIMHSDKSLARVIEFLKPHHFADPVHALIYAEQIRRINDGGIADAVTLRGWFEAEPLSQDVGGLAYLASLLTAYVGPGTMEPYAREIVASWRQRQVIDAAEELMSAGFNNDVDPAAAMSAIAARLDQTVFGTEANKGISFDTAMDSAIEASQAARDGTGPRMLSTGFRSVDEFLGGMEEGTLHVLAGRPGMGKSAIGHQMCISAARQGIAVLEISLEMTARELGRRSLSAASGVPSVFIKRGDLTPKQADALIRARHELKGLPLTIEDGSGLTVSQIAAKVRQAQRKRKLGLIMIDHLHIVRPEDSDVRQGATWAVGRISGAMKRLAKEHGCPVLLLAQLNRSVEGRDDKRPALSDLRQAGDIEQDADVVSFVYRPEYYLPKSPPDVVDGESAEKHSKRVDLYHQRKAAVAGKAELIFAKVRDGASGSVQLGFNGATTSFYEVEDERDF